MDRYIKYGTVIECVDNLRNASIYNEASGNIKYIAFVYMDGHVHKLNGLTLDAAKRIIDAVAKVLNTEGPVCREIKAE